MDFTCIALSTLISIGRYWFPDVSVEWFVPTTVSICWSSRRWEEGRESLQVDDGRLSVSVLLVTIDVTTYWLSFGRRVVHYLSGYSLAGSAVILYAGEVVVLSFCVVRLELGQIALFLILSTLYIRFPHAIPEDACMSTKFRVQHGSTVSFRDAFTASFCTGLIENSWLTLMFKCCVQLVGYSGTLCSYGDVCASLRISSRRGAT